MKYKKSLILCKVLLILLCMVINEPTFAKPKVDYLPFYKNEKYGKFRTKQKKYVFAKRDYKAALPFAVKHNSKKHKTLKNKRVKQKEAWIYRQWTRN